ncbi:MAG: sigma-70 family RNA polymerase sigma factor [Clostridia bacterium]|nr:sigma-70 family RNA polymerase sigma factor [Clostridia bacterium]MBP5238382.1 sigma-70 family RNA polymerase sigma factor [Clostridia bacterium]
MFPIILSALLDEKTDETEFETFVGEHRSLMLSAAYAVLQDHHDAEDAVINALTSIAKKFSAVSKLDPKARRVYAARCARNCALNIYNVRARRHKNESLAETELPDRAVDGEIDSLIDKLTFEQAVKCIVKLDDIYRDVLYLHYVRDMSARQIARELALNRKTVETRISRGKKLLAAIMKGETE